MGLFSALDNHHAILKVPPPRAIDSVSHSALERADADKANVGTSPTPHLISPPSASSTGRTTERTWHCAIDAHAPSSALSTLAAKLDIHEVHGYRPPSFRAPLTVRRGYDSFAGGAGTAVNLGRLRHQHAQVQPGTTRLPAHGSARLPTKRWNSISIRRRIRRIELLLRSSTRACWTRGCAGSRSWDRLLAPSRLSRRGDSDEGLVQRRERQCACYVPSQ